MALRWIVLLAPALLCACAAQRSPTTAMGAARSCDLQVDIGTDHRCAVTHVTPPQDVQLITNSTSAQMPRAVVPVR